MPATTTATWTAFTAATKARASEVNLNFDWLEQNLYPHEGGSVTDAAYDIGADGARWRRLWLSGGINPTTTAGGIAMFTTAVANASVGFEIGGTTKALLISRLTTTQRDALTPVNGMFIYNATTQKFNIYENGAWNVMGASFGFKETQTSAIGLTAQTVTAYVGSGRILGIYAHQNGGAMVPVLSMTVDGVGYTINMTIGTSYAVMTESDRADTSTAFYMAASSGAFASPGPRPFSFGFQSSFELKATAGATFESMEVKVLYETAT